MKPLIGMMQSSYHDNDPTRYSVAQIGRFRNEDSLQFRADIDFLHTLTTIPSTRMILVVQ